ncbi:MAG TPA: hypothetical protein VIH74_05005 [Candidatus Acidoferrum sp.]
MAEIPEKQECVVCGGFVDPDFRRLSPGAFETRRKSERLRPDLEMGNIGLDFGHHDDGVPGAIFPVPSVRQEVQFEVVVSPRHGLREEVRALRIGKVCQQ